MSRKSSKRVKENPSKENSSNSEIKYSENYTAQAEVILEMSGWSYERRSKAMSKLVDKAISSGNAEQIQGVQDIISNKLEYISSNSRISRRETVQNNLRALDNYLTESQRPHRFRRNNRAAEVDPKLIKSLSLLYGATILIGLPIAWNTPTILNYLESRNKDSSEPSRVYFQDKSPKDLRSITEKGLVSSPELVDEIYRSVMGESLPESLKKTRKTEAEKPFDLVKTNYPISDRQDPTTIYPENTSNLRELPNDLETLAISDTLPTIAPEVDISQVYTLEIDQDNPVLENQGNIDKSKPNISTSKRHADTNYDSNNSIIRSQDELYEILGGTKLQSLFPEKAKFVSFKVDGDREATRWFNSERIDSLSGLNSLAAQFAAFVPGYHADPDAFDKWALERGLTQVEIDSIEHTPYGASALDTVITANKDLSLSEEGFSITHTLDPEGGFSILALRSSSINVNEKIRDLKERIVSNYVAPLE